ncbi:MAG: DegT/DnrJ/EryC1/StrS family aminotransferase [Cytophagaceae bacterium]|jgi:dTDP-4-amino-4,6-dideoxygalactose transaminase|nr:DegT/DnrJ/EryC1/StrS family aminotransferase [Cytophagaceae bacterium]
MYEVYLSPPYQGGNESLYVQQALDSNWIAPYGPFVDRFSEALSQSFGGASLILTNSGTSALHLALIGAGIAEGDVVLCSTATFAGGAFPIRYVNAIPCFIDSIGLTPTIDTELLLEAIHWHQQNGKNVKALIVAHLYGFYSNLNKVKEICARYSIALIEDAAESMGSIQNESPIGIDGDFTVLSFNGNKIITAGGCGGALLIKNPELYPVLKKIANQANEKPGDYWHEKVGYNYRLSNVNAAFGLAQWEQLSQKVERKRQIRTWYRQYLPESISILLPENATEKDSAWLTIAYFPKVKDTENIKEYLKNEKIESRKPWRPMHLQPVFSNIKHFVKGSAELLYQKGLCLPSGINMTEELVKRISEKIVIFINT